MCGKHQAYAGFYGLGCIEDATNVISLSHVRARVVRKEQEAARQTRFAEMHREFIESLEQGKDE